MITVDRNIQAVITFALYGKSISLRDHSLQTAEISALLARQLLGNSADAGFSPDEAYFAGLIHDIGKLFISEAILDKPEGLTEREIEIMRLHTSWGRQFVENVGLGRFSQVVSRHHEEYPAAPPGEELDPLTKVVRTADMLSALLEDRPYRRGIVDDNFIMEKMEQGLEGLFNGSSGVIRRAIAAYLAEFRRQQKSQTRALPLVPVRSIPLEGDFPCLTP